MDRADAGVVLARAQHRDPRSSKVLAEVLVWDLPLRLFHWLLVLCVAAAYVTSKLGASFAVWHGRIGAFTLGLLIFRVIWGVVGATHARFGNFVPTATALLAHIKGEWKGVGHTPLGALAVFALLATLVVQVGTGLFASDDIAFEGPLRTLISKGTSDALAAVHATTFDILLMLIVLHVGAIVAYAVFKRTNLVRPMLTGRKALAEPTHSTDANASALRFAIAACVSAAAVWLIFNVSEREAPRAPSPVAAQAPW